MSLDVTNDNAEPAPKDEAQFVLQKVQPALLGLMDGSVSTLAPLFAAAGLTGKPMQAFLVGLAASVGAGISMGLAEALSDDGKVSGRGSPLDARRDYRRSRRHWAACFIPSRFSFPSLPLALRIAYGVVGAELLAIAFIRYKFMKSPLGETIVQVIVGGMIVFFIGLWLGHLGAGG